MAYPQMFEERSFGPQRYEIAGTRIIHTFREHWIRANRRIPARCGISGEFEFQNSRGISASEMNSLEGALEGTIGVESLVSLKSAVTEKSGVEVTFSREGSEKINLFCPAAKCGSAVYHLYQLVRDHKLEFHRSRFLRKVSKTVETLREFVGEYDFDIENVPDDPNCPCPIEQEPPKTGLVRLFMKRLRITAEYSQLPDGRLQLELGGKLYHLDDKVINVSASMIPKGWMELAGLTGDVQDFDLKFEFLPDPEDTYFTTQQIIVPEDGSSSSTPTQGL